MSLIAIATALAFVIFAVRWIVERHTEEAAWKALVVYSDQLAPQVDAIIDETTEPCAASSSGLPGTTVALFPAASTAQDLLHINRLRKVLTNDGWTITSVPPNSDWYEPGDFEGTKKVRGHDAIVFTTTNGPGDRRGYEVGLEAKYCLLGL